MNLDCAFHLYMVRSVTPSIMAILGILTCVAISLAALCWVAVSGFSLDKLPHFLVGDFDGLPTGTQERAVALVPVHLDLV